VVLQNTAAGASAEPRRHDTPWSPYRRFRPRLRGLLEEALADLEALEVRLGNRKRARNARDAETFALAVEALLADAAHVYLARGHAARLHLSVRNSYLMGSPRYRPKAVGKGLKHALSLLAHPEVGPWLIHHRPTSPGEQTMIAPGSRLCDRLSALCASADDLHSVFEGEEVVVLRAERAEASYFSPEDTRGQLQDYDESDETHRLRAEVREINTRLQSLKVDVVDGPTVRRLDMASVFMRRVFTRGGFDTGGRLWSATGNAEWYSMPGPNAKGVPPEKKRLALLRIEGEEVASVDIKSASLAILYAMCGQPLPEGDLYLPPGYHRDFRDTFKLAGVCTLFRKRKSRRWPKDAKDTPKLPAAGAFREFERLNWRVAGHLWQGKGHAIQRVESDILVRALLMAPDLPALPLHDALIVPASRAEEAARTLEAAFSETTGGRCRVEIERNAQPPTQSFSPSTPARLAAAAA
jgi:hypothetical protein